MLLNVQGGRRLVPTEAGIVIARTVSVESLRLSALQDDPLEIAPFTFAVSNRPDTLGVGGILGVDFFARFSRITFESPGSRRILRLEE